MSVSVFLVEDEVWIRRGIKKMIRWEALDAVLVGEAEDGIEAKEKILEMRPQIILTDIRIPRMDGLELVRQVMREYPVKAIFISGYREFDYARQALALDAVSYILKPVDSEELHQVLVETLGKIRQEQLRSREADYGKGSFMINVLEERVGDKTWEMMAPEMTDTVYRVLLIPANEPQITSERFKTLLEQPWGNGLNGEFFVKNKHEYVVIFSSQIKIDFDGRTKAGAQALMEAAGSTRAWALGDVVDKLSEIPVSYNHAWMAYAQREARVHRALLIYKPGDCAEFMLPGSARVETLRFAVETGDHTKINQELELLLQELTVSGCTGMQSLSDFIFFLSMDYIRVLQKEGVSTGGYYRQCQEFLSRRTQLRDSGEIFDWFKELLLCMAEDVNRKRMKSIQLTIMQVREYIDVHYTENISLTEMAEKVYINPNYLSTSFKKVTGERFVDVYY